MNPLIADCILTSVCVCWRVQCNVALFIIFHRLSSDTDDDFPQPCAKKTKVEIGYGHDDYDDDAPSLVVGTIVLLSDAN